MTDTLRGRVLPVELSADARFAGRVRRLAFTAVVALGVLWALATVTLEAPVAIDLALLLGWLSMPTLLFASLRDARWRYALVLPSALVGVPLLAICAFWLPEGPVAAAGWLLVTAGILLGSVLGLWFWYRLLPVPAALDDPFSPGRWTLISIHIGLIVAGLALAATALASGS
ncbi:MAG TPA: hypothetical protein VFH79_10855 [Candidatus Limnocylindria bacterium]|jgi:hypothetical protein|nr:hypothetical protein [Candidatus Limnocylindria bacterium]